MGIRLNVDKDRVNKYVLEQCHSFVKSYNDMVDSDADAINYVYNSFAKDNKRYSFGNEKNDKKEFIKWLHGVKSPAHALINYRINSELKALSDWTGIDVNKIDKAMSDDDVVTDKYIDIFTDSFFDLYNESKNDKETYSKSYNELNFNEINDLGHLDFEYDGNEYTVEVKVDPDTPVDTKGNLNPYSTMGLIVDFITWTDGEKINEQKVELSSVATLDIENEIRYYLYYRILKTVVKVKDFKERKKIAYSFTISPKKSAVTSSVKITDLDSLLDRWNRV